MHAQTAAAGLSTNELDLLQDCFDNLIVSSSLQPSSEDASAIARALILAYQRGVRDKVELIRLSALFQEV